MTQYMRPTGSPTVVGWTGLVADVADASGVDDATYIASPVSPDSGSYWECDLSGATDPNTDNGLVLRFRPVLNAASGDAQTVSVRIFRASDNTTVVSQTAPVGYPLGEVVVTLSAAQAATIASFASGALRVRVSAAAPAGVVVATPTVATAGYASMGITLPKGTARAVGFVGYASQCDVKTTWDDGSLRFGIVSARLTGTGPVGVQSVAASTPTPYVPTWPTASVQLTISGTAYTATLPAFSAADPWLSGAVVTETRVKVTPTTSGGTAHPFVRVLFDVRSYAGSGRRVDVAVENVLNVATATSVTYAALVTVGGVVAYSGTLTHSYLSRWRVTALTGGLTEAVVTPDLASTVRATTVVPAYRSDVLAHTYSATGAAFVPMGYGGLSTYMPATGGRPEVGPFPEWVGQYVVNPTASTRDYVLWHGGNGAGTWSIHLTESDGTPVRLTEKPSFWLDGYGGNTPRYVMDGTGTFGPANNMAGTGNVPDVSHQPSLAFVPYLLTGDRYYYDEMRYWAHFCVLSQCYLPTYRNYAQGIINEQTRAVAWGLRNLADFVAYSLDTDADRAYFQTILTNNFAYLETMAAGTTSPLGAVFLGEPFLYGTDYAQAITPWQQAYIAWALEHVRLLGFAGAPTMFTVLITQMAGMFAAQAAGQYPTAALAPRVLRMGNGAFFNTWADVSAGTFPSSTSTDWTGTASWPALPGYSAAEERLALLFAERASISGAAVARTYIDTTGGALTDARDRSQWAIEIDAF